MKYRTKDGDVLDKICRDYYGSNPHSVEAVYDANPGLAWLGPVLPSGVLITLPNADDTRPAPATVRLWD